MDLYHDMGGDLVLTATGDLALVDGPILTQQRVLRRLLTNRLAYLWAPGYGAGLGGQVGKPANAQRIQAIILAQMRLEAGVAQSPPPSVAVSVDNATGTVSALITYTDTTTGQTVSFTLPGA